MTRSEEQAAFAKGVWCDSYNFYLKYHGHLANSAAWEKAMEDFTKILEKYKQAATCRRIMLATISLLEEENE